MCSFVALEKDPKGASFQLSINLWFIGSVVLLSIPTWPPSSSVSVHYSPSPLPTVASYFLSVSISLPSLVCVLSRSASRLRAVMGFSHAAGSKWRPCSRKLMLMLTGITDSPPRHRVVRNDCATSSRPGPITCHIWIQRPERGEKVYCLGLEEGGGGGVECLW